MAGIKPKAATSSRFFLFPLWLTGPWGWVGIIAILYTLLNIAWTYFHWGGPERVTLIANLFSFLPSLLAMASAWRVAIHKDFNVPLRRAWFLLGLSFLMFLVGNVIWAYLEVVLQVEPFPSLADVFYLAFYPLALWGLLAMPGAQQNRRESLTLWLDLFSVLTAAAMFVLYFIIIPTAAISSGDLLTQIIASAYPISSLFLTGGMLAILYHRRSPASRPALLFLLMGMAIFLGADFVFGYSSLIGTYEVGGWTDAGWNIAQLFFVLAALRPIYPAPVPSEPRQWLTVLNGFVRRLPLISILLGYGLVLYVLIVKFHPAAIWLLAGALLLTVLVISRQIVTSGFANLPIRLKVILTFFLVCALSVSLVTLTSYLTIRSNLQSTVEISLKAHAQDRARSIAGLLAKQSEALEAFVLDTEIQNLTSATSAAYATDNLDTIWAELSQRDLVWKAAVDGDPLVQDVLHNVAADALHKFRNNFPAYLDLLLTDKYGAVLAATTRPTTYDQSLLGWWQTAFHNGQGAIYFSQPILDPGTQSRYLIIAIPVRSDLNSDLVGILMATYNFKNMAQLLAIEDLEQVVEYHLVLPTGQMLAAGDQLVFIDQNTLERLQATAAVDSALMNFDGSPQLVSQAVIMADDPEEVMATESLNWIVVAHQEPAQAFAPLNEAWRATLLSTVIVLLLTAGLAVVLAQVLAAPIVRLTAATRQIGAGDLSTKAQVESRDEVGTLAATFNTMLDALAQTQQELQQSESLYRSLVDYSPDMIVVHSEGRILFINPAGVNLMRAPNAEEFVGQPVMNMIHPQDQEMAAEELEHIKDVGGPSPLLQRKMHRLDGTTFDAEFRVIPISYAGRPAIQFVMRDITERKEAEEKIRQLLMEVGRQRTDLEIRVAQRTQELNKLNLQLQDELEQRQRLVQSLQESEQRFHLVFETSPDAILLIDPHDPHASWPIVDCNEIACAMNGYTREELIGQSIDILNTTPGVPAERKAYLDRIRQRGILHQEAVHRHKDGHLFPVDISTSLLTIGERELVLGIDRDITERKQAEEVLRRTKEMAEAASRAKSEFLSRMSHELRTPMNAILGFAQLLTMSQKDPLTTTQKDRVKQIVKGGEHLLDLINEILDISRIEAGRVQISPEPVSIRESLQEALDLTMPLANNRSIQIQLSLPEKSNPFVLADRQRLKQILLNLLSNAVKYNRPGGFVTIVCEVSQSDRTAWRISVTDTGPGIAREDLSHLFVPFERLSADQSNVEGTGLGLALAKRLVELMQGQIGVESLLGQGSTFWIELPATESPLDRLQRTGGTGKLPAMPETHRTILYIEDNVANFELVQQVLADYGQIELLWANDFETSMALAHQRHPNLILLDLHLGGKDGREVLRQLKDNEKTANIPVIMVSADATAGQAERLMALGAHSYLTKPLDMKLFIQRIEQLLRHEAMSDGKH
jgi:PAS domain S-box-containing protein